jgi:uroporphyrinogen decarboxylase
MNSRERVHRAISFQKPDRVPIDLGAMRASSINAVLYDKLKKHLGIKTPTKVHGTLDVLACVEPEVMDRFHLDVLPLEAALCEWDEMSYSAGVCYRLYDGTDVWFPPGTNITRERDASYLLRNAHGAPYARMPADGFYFDYITPAMGGGRIAPTKFRPSHTVDGRVLDAFARRARFLNESTDKALLGWGSGVSFLGLSFLLSDNITQGSLDEWLCMLMTEKPAVHEMMARSIDAAIDRTRLFHQAVGDLIEIWGVASDDAGTQRSGLIAPDLFAEMIAPHYKRLCDWIHANTNWKTLLHSCGSIHDYIGPWIEAGIDIINPVQISAAKMEPELLMREFGGRVVFWGGGCDTQRVLALSSPAEVREHVRQNVRAFSAGRGGFVFSQVHNIQPNVPVANIIAMLDAAWECGAMPS